MQQKTYDIDLNVREKKFLRTNIVINQGDNRTTVLKIKIYDGVNEIDYNDVSMAVIAFSKPDKSTSQSTLIKIADGYMHTIVKNNISSAGSVIAGVMLYGEDGERLTTCYFAFGVIDDLMSPDAVLNSSEFDALWEAMKLLERAQKKFEEIPNLVILGSYKTIQELTSAHPDGSDLGGGFFVDSFRPPHYYYWNFDTGWTDIGPIQGEQGALWFNLSATTSTAPVGARIDDIVQNVGAATYTIGGVSMLIGDVGRITSLSPFTVVKQGNNRGATGAQGIQGAMINPVTTAITTAPAGARIGDLILNGGAASLTIGGRALAIGDCAAITVLSPLTLGAVAGNLRGAIGAQGIQGIQGSLIFLLTAATSTAPAGSRLGDKVLNGGSTIYTIGGIALDIGDMANITSLSPFTVVKQGNIRGPMGPATLPLINNLTQATPGVGALDAVQGKVLEEKKADKTLILSGGRNKCYKLGSFPVAHTANHDSEALIFNIVDSMWYDSIGETKIIIDRVGKIFVELIGLTINFHTYIATYLNGTNVDIYLFADNYCDYWKLHLDYKRNMSAAFPDIKDLGANTYAPPGTLISNSKTGEGCIGAEYHNAKKVLTEGIETTTPPTGTNNGLIATTKFVQDTQAAFVEEGTWTPRIEGSTVAGVNTYSIQQGYYCKVGKLITLNCRCAITGKDSSASGAFVIRGLPYRTSTKTNYNATGSILTSGVSYPTGSHLGIMVAPNDTTVLFRANSSGASPFDLTMSNVGDATDIRFSIQYEIA